MVKSAPYESCLYTGTTGSGKTLAALSRAWHRYDDGGDVVIIDCMGTIETDDSNDLSDLERYMSNYTRDENSIPRFNGAPSIQRVYEAFHDKAKRTGRGTYVVIDEIGLCEWPGRRETMRLTAKTRHVGISIIATTQRMYDIPPEARRFFHRTFVGYTNFPTEIRAGLDLIKPLDGSMPDKPHEFFDTAERKIVTPRVDRNFDFIRSTHGMEFWG